MPSPDVSTAVDLTIYDLTPSDLVDRAILAAQTVLPEAALPDGSIEMTLLEAISVIVAELVYAINRIPGAVLESLLTLLYGIARSSGLAPTTSIRFTAGPSGASIPVNTLVQVGSGEVLVLFATDAELTLVSGVTTGTVTATSTTQTDAVNGTATGTPVQVVSAVTGVTGVTLAAPIGGGAGPEDAGAYLSRASNRLARLSDTLVAPEHFTDFALEQPGVYRARTIDDTTTDTLSTPSGVTATPSTTGGTLAAGTYSYRASAVNAAGETLASTAVTATTTGTTGSVVVGWAAVTAPAGVGAVTGYRVYGRTGTVGVLTTTAAGTLTYTDTGAATPGAGVATANTTGTAVAAAPGHVSVAVLDPAGATLTTTAKTALQATMDAESYAPLIVHVIDPTITTVPVTATIKALPGFAATTVQASAVAALQAYLSPLAWGWGATVRRNDLIAVLEAVPGVDYVQAGHPTAPAGDVALSGVAPLAQAGVLTITVTT